MSRKVFFFLAVNIALISCNQKSKNHKQLFDHAENLMFEKPDSALSLLDRIKIDQLTENQHHHYLVLKVCAKDRTHKDISQDTLIFQTAKYFARQKDYNIAGWGSYISGRVCQEGKNDDAALRWYLESIDYAKKTGNHLQKGLSQNNIGALYCTKGQYGNANEWFQAAYHTLSRDTNSITQALQVRILLSIGNSFLLMENNEGALVYYQKAMDDAVQFGNNDTKAMVFHNIGIIYNDFDKYEESDINLKQAVNLTTRNKLKIQSMIALSHNYLKQSQVDSAKHYAQRALDLYKAHNVKMVGGLIYEMLSKIEEKTSQYKNALEYLKQVVNEINNCQKEKNIRSIAEKNANTIQQQKDLSDKKKKIYQLSSMIGVLLLIVVFILNYLRNVKSKNKLLATTKALEAVNEINKYKNDLILQHLNFIRKAALLKQYSDSESNIRDVEMLKQTREVIAGINFDMIMQIVNTIHKGFSDWIIITYPELQENEIYVCCLEFIGLTDKEVAAILGYKRSTISQRKSDIRKKINLESRKDLQEYLIEGYKTCHHIAS